MKKIKIDYVQWAMYLIGIQILTMAVAFLNESGLGATPIDSGFISVAKYTNVPVAVWMNGFGLIMLIVTGFVLKKIPNFFTYIPTFIMAGSLNMWLVILDGKIHPGVVSFIIGLLLHAFGIAVYLSSQGIPNAIDYFMVNLCETKKIKLMWVRMAIDGFGVALVLITGGKLGLGTIILLFFIGPLIQFFMKKIMYLKLRIERIIANKKDLKLYE